MQDNANSELPAPKRMLWNKWKTNRRQAPKPQTFIGTILAKPNPRPRQTLGTANFTGVCH